MPSQSTEQVVVGRIAGIFGVRGWLRVESHTDPKENILGYSPWQVETESGWTEVRIEEGRPHGKGIVAKLDLCADRDEARLLIGREITVERRQLPAPETGEYYWTDLVGLRVVTRDGEVLGSVSTLMSTGANDVLVVQGERERLIPFIGNDVVLDVDLGESLITVDWDPAF